MRTYRVIGIALVFGLQAKSAIQAADCSVNVYLLAGAPMPAGMSGEARRMATQIFREIGVNVRMRDGVPARDPGDGCGAPIVVQIEDGKGYRGHAEAMAYAKPYKESGICIHVFIERVVRLNPEPGFANILLAYVMAHEISHVLEGIQRHSEEGVMKGAWSGQDYAQMKDHRLLFASEDVRLIREGLARRITRTAAD